MTQSAQSFDHKKILEEVAKTSIDLLTKGEPFFAHLIGGVNRQVVENPDEIPTLAVGMTGNSFTLFINADFWTNHLTSPEHRRGVLKHEMLHLVFKHLTAQDTGFDRKLINIAFDLVVNQYVDRKLLPDESIFLSTFPDLALLPHQTWYYYYKRLEETQRKQEGDGSGKQSREALSSIQDDSHGLERHQPWKEIKNRSELDKSVAETHLDTLLKTAQQRTNAHAWGNLPGQVQEALNQLFVRPAPEIDWRLVIKLFSESAFKTRLKNTLKRPSKRYGTSPGIKVRRKQRLMVAVDTSGSIGQQDLDFFFSEIFHLWRTGTEIEIVECDTKIQRRYFFKGATPAAVIGRGGTDFNEPLELANIQKPDGLIYFTDGYAARPTVTPRMPVLWVITKQGLKTDHDDYRNLPGKKVKMAI